MNLLPDLHRSEEKSERSRKRLLTPRLSILILFLFGGVWGASAQTIIWKDSFQQGVAPTAEQCRNWSGFLSALDGKSFASVTIAGEFDQVGKTITDPAAATELARLLSSKTPGTVTSGIHTWTVTQCDLSNCLDGFSIALSVDGSTESCLCSDTYAIRPQSKNEDWGGINTGTSCNAKSQYMSLEFHTGVSIVADGSTSICEGGSVVLTAESTICTSSMSYLWTNGETTQSITVTEAGSYSVTVSSTDGCSGTSAPVEVTQSQISVDAGQDVTLCEEAIQLNAIGTSVGGTGETMVNKVCLFDSPGNVGGVNCDFSAKNVCLEGTTAVGNATYSKFVSFANPVELRYNIYYTADWYGDFFFKLNGQLLGSYKEIDPSGACEVIGGLRAPRTFVFSAHQFRQYWNENTDNTLTVQIAAMDGAIHLAGLLVEVVTSSESYSWSPSAGLSVASIPNPFASPEISTVYTVTYTDASGCTATDQVAVNVKCNTAPVAVCREVSVEIEGNCEAMVEAASFDGGSSTASGGALAFSVSPAGPYSVGRTEVLLTVTDINGESSTCATTVTVIDAVLPEIVTPDDLTVPNDPGECFATLTLAEPQTSDNCGVKSISNDHEGNAFSEGETVVTWTVTDIHGNQKSTTQKVTVINTDPLIDGVDASASFVVVNSPITLTIAYTDDNVSDASLDWGDGSAPESVTDPANVFQVSHTYVNSGSYSVTISLTDACGADTYTYESVMVINDRKGSASGGGWYTSGPGAYPTDPRAAGKATLAFQVSNENRNQTKGHVVFNFKEAKIKFRSTRFEWVSLEEEKAIMKAFGRLNGIDDYQILISVLADDNKDNADSESNAGGKQQSIDYVRIKIWDPSGAVIYDTQSGSPDDATATTPLGGGSMKVDLEKTSVKTKFESPVASSYGGESSSAYPNPFKDWVDVQFNSASSENVVIQVLDLSGKVIFNQVFPASEDGRYPLDIQEDKDEKGIYILIIKQGKKVEFHRLVRE